MVTRELLNQRLCPTAGCRGDHGLQLTGTCHPGAPVMAEYDKDVGSLHLSCAVCQESVVVVAVAYNDDLQ